MFPSGTKRSEKKKLCSRNEEIKTRNIASNTNLQKQHSSKENIYSSRSINLSLLLDTTKDKQQQLKSNINYKYESSSVLHETISSNSLVSAPSTKENSLKFTLSSKIYEY